MHINCCQSADPHYSHISEFRLQCPVSLKTVQDGDHRLSRPHDIELIISAVAELLIPPNDRGESTADSTDQDQDD